MGLYCLRESQQAFPQLVQMLWFLLQLKDAAQQQPRVSSDKTRFLLSHLEGHTGQWPVWRGEGAQIWASAFLGVQGWGGVVKQEPGAGRDMWGHSHGYLGCPRFSRKENLMGEAGVGAYLEAGIQLTMCSCKTRVSNRSWSNQKLDTSPLGSGMFTEVPTVPKASFLQDLVNTCQVFERVRWPTHLEQILWSTGQRTDSLR